MYTPLLFIYSLDGHLGCFHNLAIVNNTAMFESLFNFGGYIPRNISAGLYSNIMFNFLRSHQIVFHSEHTILHSQEQCMRVPISPFSSTLVLF